MLQPEHDVGGFKAVIFKFIINPCASILCFYPTLAAPSWGRNSPSEGDKRTAPPTPVHQHRPGLGRVRSPHRPGLLSSNARLCSKGHKAETGRPRALQGRERGLQCGRLSHPGPGFPLTATSFPPDLHLRVPSQSLRTQSPEAQAAAGSLGKAVSCPSRVPDIPAGHRYPCSWPHGVSGRSRNPGTGFARWVTVPRDMRALPRPLLTAGHWGHHPWAPPQTRQPPPGSEPTHPVPPC